MDKSNTKSTLLPAYNKPPVIEVVCGLEFRKLSKFSAPFIGLFWQEIRDRFPTCEQTTPLGSISMPPDPSELFLPLPRVWFLNEQKDKLIQLQNDRFLYNWRQMRPDDDYPHYVEIIKEFRDNLEVFQAFLDNEELGSIEPHNCELTYINHIPMGEGWDALSEINNVLRDIAWKDQKNRFLPEPLNWMWQTAFELPEKQGHLNVKLQTAIRKADDIKLLILEMRAKGLSKEDRSKDNIWQWYDLAHEWIVRGFTDITSQKIQDERWLRSDNVPIK